MKKLLLALVLVGCGTEDDQLAGTEWSAPLDAQCTKLAFFSDVDNYSASVVCSVDSRVVVQFDRGTYAIDGDRLAVKIAESSCSSAVIEPGPFAVDGDRLTVGGVVFDRAFQRIDPSTSIGGTFERGCLSP